MMQQQKVVIVGAGMAGLTAAAYLTRENYEVLVIDKNDRCGGLVTTFEYEGFSFDAGPRAFVNSGMVKPMFKDLGIQAELLENVISIGVEDELFQVDSMDTIQEYQEILKRLYPENADDIEKLTSAIAEFSEYTKILYEFDNPNFIDFSKNRLVTFRKLLPWTFKFLYALRKMNQYGMPMEGFLAEITDNQSLIDVVTQLFFRKTPAYFALGYYYVYLDYFYPKGGTGVLPALLKHKAIEGGAEFKLNTEIVEVNPAQSFLLDTEANQYSYDHLIWAADLKNLYRFANLSGLDSDTVQQAELQKHKLLASKGAESVLIAFMGVNRPPAYFAERGGEHMFYTPSRKGLGDTHLARREKLLAEFDQLSREDVLDWLDDFLDLNTFEVAIPALRDASLAPDGQTGVMVSCLFDYDLVQKIEKAGWYPEFKDIVLERIIRIFSNTIYEGIEQDILFKFISTPLTINKVAGSSEGAITGWSFETPLPVAHELTAIPKSVLTAFPDVYQAGQWAYAPAGVPIAMLTGWNAAQKVIKS